MKSFGSCVRIRFEYHHSMIVGGWPFLASGNFSTTVSSMVHKWFPFSSCISLKKVNLVNLLYLSFYHYCSELTLVLSLVKHKIVLLDSQYVDRDLCPKTLLGVSVDWSLEVHILGMLFPHSVDILYRYVVEETSDNRLIHLKCVKYGDEWKIFECIILPSKPKHILIHCYSCLDNLEIW